MLQENESEWQQGFLASFLSLSHVGFHFSTLLDIITLSYASPFVR